MVPACLLQKWNRNNKWAWGEEDRVEGEYGEELPTLKDI